MQADVFQGDTDEQLIVFDDDRPDDASDDDDDDPGKYGEDAMPDDFFDQFVKHKIPGTRVTNTSANKKSSSSSSSVNEGLLLPLRSVTTSEQQPQTTTTTLDREAKQQPENDSNNDKIRIERLKKDAIEATETIRAVEEALRDALDWPLRGDSNRMCSRTELIGLVKHLKSDVLESRENAMRAREQLTTMKASSFSGGDGGIPSKVSINNFAVQLERVNREKRRARTREETRGVRKQEISTGCGTNERDETRLRDCFAKNFGEVTKRVARSNTIYIAKVSRGETKVGDAKMQVDVAEKRTQRAIQEMERAKSVATTRTDRAQSAELRAKQAIEDAKEKKKERDELFRETRALEKKCLDLATNNNYGGRNENGRSHTNEHSRTIAELSALSQELAREEMMTRKRCEDVEKERDVLRLELVSVQAELKAMKEEINRAHERDINYVMSSSGGKGLTYHQEQYPPPPPPPPTTTTLQQQQQQTEMTGAGVEEATPGFGFFQTTTQPATGRVLQFEREDVPKPSESIASLEKDPAISATETTTKSTMTPLAEKQKNLALLKELAETRRMIKEERAMRLQAEQKLAT
ncbi:unnamed protein product [Bathycoccus prasinos]